MVTRLVLLGEVVFQNKSSQPESLVIFKIMP
jgi:hypothetical protein